MVKSQKKEIIIKEVIVENFFRLFLYEDGIIEINWDDKVREITIEQLVLLKEKIGEVGNYKKSLVYIETPDFISATVEAKKHSTTKESAEYTFANAILIDNLGKKIAFNFYIRLTTPPVPTKAFGSREKAFEWLRSLKKNDLSK